MIRTMSDLNSLVHAAVGHVKADVQNAKTRITNHVSALETMVARLPAEAVEDVKAALAQASDKLVAAEHHLEEALAVAKSSR